MRLRSVLFLCLASLLCVPAAAQEVSAAADLVLVNGKVWTGEESKPTAQAVAVRGSRIVRVGSNREVRALAGPQTRVLDLKGRLVLPGFIDNHVHFAQAGRLLLGLNLLDVNDAESFRRRVSEAAERLPAGVWLTGGDWGAYAQWAAGSGGADESARKKEFTPTKAVMDGVTGGRPALISRFDREVYLANSPALEAAGITAQTPDPEGGEIVRDAGGNPTGLLRGSAYELVQKVVPRPSHAQRRAEALRALEEARQWGVTTVHDNTATFEELELLRELHSSGELTTRVWARMWLSEWEAVREHIERNRIPARAGGWGDEHILLGGLKAWVDGIMGNSTALFREPYDHRPGDRGRLRPVMFPEGNLHQLMERADKAGFTVTVHAIGDEANRILLDTYEKIFAANPKRDRRFRVVHAQVVDKGDFPRFGKLGLIAEVQPYHCIDDMRWMEERIGARSRGAYAFRDLIEGGARMSFGSDWPGTNASYYPINPLLGIYAAVTRQTLNGEPPGGWFPEQRVSMEEAVRAFTIGNAYATFEEDLKGSITAGKLADMVVLDRDIFSRPPAELRDTKVLYTVFNGRVVYDGSAAK